MWISEYLLSGSENWRPHLSERMCVREKRAMEMRMKAVSQVTRALIRWRYTAHTSTGGTLTCHTSNIAYRSKVDQSPNFLCNNRTNYFSKKSHTLLSCWPGFSSRFAVRRMWRLRIFPAITQMLPNSVYKYQTQFTENSNYSYSRQEHPLEVKSYSCLQRSVFWFTSWIYKTKG